MEQSCPLFQVRGQAMAMARGPKCASHWQGKENFRNNVPGSSGVSCCCGRKNGQCKSGFFVTHCFVKIQEPRVPKLQSFPCSSSSRNRNSNGKLRRAPCSVVLNEMGESSSQVPQGLASPDELKNQLEGLQDEALQVRNRYNNARARFMRLTEVAHQLRQRAALDLDLGNEDGARKALIEKQKVIKAAELSKKRAQLLEELSTKLGEAVSVKETQLIVALSSPQRKEPTVIVVSPKGEGENSVDVVPDSGDLLVEEEKESLAAELGYSTDRYLYGNEEDMGESSMELDSNKTNLPLEGEESVRDYRDVDVQPGQLRKDFFEGALSASGLNGGAEEGVSDVGNPNMLSSVSDFHDIHNSESGSTLNGDLDEESFKSSPESSDSQNRGEEMGSQISVDDKGLLEQNGGRLTSREDDVRSRLVEDLMLELNKVAEIESRIRTAVSGNMDTSDIDLQLVRDLLERVRSLRAWISEFVTQKEETQ